MSKYLRLPFASTRHAGCSILLLVLAWASPAATAPTPWMFDFDPKIANNPTYVNQHLKTLKTGLPGLPQSGIVELTSKQTKLYFYQDVIDALIRARDSGPGIAPTVTRKPQHCVEHFAFSKPSLLVDPPPSLCNLNQQTVMAAFDQAKIKTCGYVEFPESYVYDHTPLALILPTTTADIDVLIAILGEALTHLLYPTNLIPANLLPQARNILAKVRYKKLKVELANRKQEYQKALGDLQANKHCYKPAARTAFASKVGKLLGELKSVEQDLDALYNAGLAQAVLDRKAVEAKGRKRVDLPYPALTDRERELLAFYIGGLVWRVRGDGLINENKIPLGLALTFVGPPYQLIANIAGGADGQGAGFPIYINENSGYYLWYDMGTDPGSNDKYADLVQMTNRGKMATALVTPLIAGRGYDTRHLVAGGLMMGPCYYYIWEELPTFTLGLACKPKAGFPLPANTPGCLAAPHYTQFLEWPTATGEFCTGAALALGLVKTLLGGKPGAACTPYCFGKPCGAADTCGGTCGVCPDAGTVGTPDGSVSTSDGGSPSADGSPNADGSAGKADGGNDGGASEQPSTSGGCNVGSLPAPPLLALVMVLMLCLLPRSRRR
jgi:hypothetical protein